MAEVREYWLGDVDRLSRRFGPHDPLVVEGKAAAGPIDREGRSIGFTAQVYTPALIAVRQFACSGWLVRIDRRDWQPAKRPPGLEEVIGVGVPAESRRIELRMPPLPAESRGIMLS